MTATTDSPTRAELGRPLPHDFQAEQSVLGGMLLAQAAIVDVIETLAGGKDFYRPEHQLVYDTILDLYARGEPADPVTVAAELTRAGTLTRVGGAPYLHTLISSVPTAANAGYYAEIVAERAVLRRLVEAGTRIVQLGYGATANGSDTDAVVDHAQAQVEAVRGGRVGGGAVLLSSRFDATMTHLDGIHETSAKDADKRGGAVLSGFRDLDGITNGFQPGQLIVVAARPAIGKSTLALDFCRHCSIVNNTPSLLMSLEMSTQELVLKVLSAEAKVPLHHMRSGTMSDDEWGRLARRMGEMWDAPLYVDDSPNMTVMDVRAQARRMVQSHDIRFLVVDYLQLMTSGRRVENRQAEVSEFSRSLKLLAKELGIPVVALSQLNRGPEQRQDKKPLLSDLRESGAIEQDADLVVFVHREDAYDRESPRAGEADLILAKHRNGPTGVVTVAFQGHYSRFVDMAA